MRISFGIRYNISVTRGSNWVKRAQIRDIWSKWAKNDKFTSLWRHWKSASVKTSTFRLPLVSSLNLQIYRYHLENISQEYITEIHMGLGITILTSTSNGPNKCQREAVRGAQPEQKKIKKARWCTNQLHLLIGALCGSVCM